MSEATIEAPPAQSQSATGGSATFDFAQQMAASVAKEVAGTPEPPAEPTAPAEATPEAPKETPKETAPTTEPAKETKPAASEKPMSEWTDKDFDAAMKKAPSKAWKVYEFAKSKYEARVKELEGKIKTVEAKPVEAPGDAKKIEAYEKQIKELGDKTSEYLKTIAELDYSRSPEFKKQYTERLASAYQTAVDEIKQLTVAEGDVQRPATQQDFDLLMRLPLKEQIARAKAMFGDTADAFFSHRNEVQRIQREGREALTRAQEEAESKRTQAEVQTKEQERLYESQLEVEHKDLVDKFPELFGDTDNQEAAAAMQKGLDFAKRALGERAKMSPAERASHDAVLQATHAGFRRLVVEKKAADAEIETLKTELAKYRKSDPGSATAGKAPPATNGDELIGIEGMAKMYQKA